MKKEIQVVMLPTEKANKCVAIQYFEDGTKSMDFWEDGCVREHPVEGCTEYEANCIVPQHLYFLSDEKIVDGDVFLENGQLFVAHSNFVRLNLNPNIFKVIASTSDVFNLPRPSNEFLKKFCELGGIDKVLVEYEPDRPLNSTHYAMGSFNWILKVAPDNTISIFPI